MPEQMADMSETVKIMPWMLAFIYCDYYNYDVPPLALNEFLIFVSGLAKSNPDLMDGIYTETLSQLDMIAVFTDKNELSKERSTVEISSLFGIDENAYLSAFRSVR